MKFRFVTAAVAAIGATLLTALPTFAAPAQAVSALNVRSGPSTSYAVVDVLYQGETVNVTNCNAGWCAITHNGPDGYVSGRYLTQTVGQRPPPPPPPATPRPQPQNPQVGFCIDAPNFQFGVNCNQNNVYPRPGFPNTRPPSSNAEVCFYEDANYNGRSICARPGQAASRLNSFNDRISSVTVSGGASAYVCEDVNFGGRCATISSSRSYLGNRNNDIISSFRVR